MAAAVNNKPSGKKRFASVNTEEFSEIIKAKDSAATNRSTDVAVNIFRAYLKEKELDIEFEKYEKSQLATVLEKFYVEARREDGQLYKTGTMTNIRASLNRHLKNNGHVVNLLSDSEFAQANLSFAANKAKLKRLGYGDTQHYLPIDDNDMKKLYSSGVFNQDTPDGLQNKVWFELMLYICRRGRENLRKLQKDHFAIAVDSDGRRYVYQAKDEMTKKMRAECSESRVDGGRMYATGGEGCPVASFEKYLSKLNPMIDVLFQAPKRCAPAHDDEPWYKNSPVGEKTLGNFMAKLSTAAGLSRRYTNHSIRSTCITLLDHSGFDARDICNVSGHRNEGSIRTYIGRPNDMKRQKLSDALAKCTHSTVTSPSASSNTTCSLNDENVPPIPPCEPSTSTYDDVSDLETGFLTSSQTEVELLATDLELKAVDEVLRGQNQLSPTAISHRSIKMTNHQVQRAAPSMNFNKCNVTINYFGGTGGPPGPQ